MHQIIQRFIHGALFNVNLYHNTCFPAELIHDLKEGYHFDLTIYS